MTRRRSRTTCLSSARVGAHAAAVTSTAASVARQNRTVGGENGLIITAPRHLKNHTLTESPTLRAGLRRVQAYWQAERDKKCVRKLLRYVPWNTGIPSVAKRNLPDRAWRFGPTQALSGRGDQFLGDAGRVERSGRHQAHRPGTGCFVTWPRRSKQLADAPPALASGERIEDPSGKELPQSLCRLGELKSPDGPEFLPSFNLPR